MIIMEKLNTRKGLLLKILFWWVDKIANVALFLTSDGKSEKDRTKTGEARCQVVSFLKI